MASVGEKMRVARLDKGLELADLSARTKISARFLAAIEADDRESIPGGFFYRSWVQQYARALSLDPAVLTAEIDQLLIHEQAPPLPGQNSLSNREIKPARISMDGPSGAGSRLAYSFVLLVAVVLGCSGLYAWWHKAVQSQDARVESNSSGTPVSAAAKQTAAPPEAAQPVAEPSAATPAPVDSQPVAKVADPPVTTAADGDVQIEISATEQTWVSISGDGKEAFSGILQPAEIKTVAAKDVARIRVGNAGGLQVRLNGKSIGPIGTAGQVRTVIFNKTGFQILEAKPATPAPVASIRRLRKVLRCRGCPAIASSFGDQQFPAAA